MLFDRKLPCNCSEQTSMVLPFSRSASCSPIQAITEIPQSIAFLVLMPTTLLVSPTIRLIESDEGRKARDNFCLYKKCTWKAKSYAALAVTSKGPLYSAVREHLSTVLTGEGTVSLLEADILGTDSNIRTEQRLRSSQVDRRGCDDNLYHKIAFLV